MPAEILTHVHDSRHGVGVEGTPTDKGSSGWLDVIQGTENVGELLFERIRVRDIRRIGQQGYQAMVITAVKIELVQRAVDIGLPLAGTGILVFGQDVIAVVQIGSGIIGEHPLEPLEVTTMDELPSFLRIVTTASKQVEGGEGVAVGLNDGGKPTPHIGLHMRMSKKVVTTTCQRDQMLRIEVVLPLTLPLPAGVKETVGQEIVHGTHRLGEPLREEERVKSGICQRHLPFQGTGYHELVGVDRDVVGSDGFRSLTDSLVTDPVDRGIRPRRGMVKEAGHHQGQSLANMVPLVLVQEIIGQVIGDGHLVLSKLPSLAHGVTGIGRIGEDIVGPSVHRLGKVGGASVDSRLPSLHQALKGLHRHFTGENGKAGRSGRVCRDPIGQH